MDGSRKPMKSMCVSCKDKYVVGFSPSLTTDVVPSAVFQVAKQRYMHKDDLAVNHCGTLTIVDDHIREKILGYCAATTLCRFSQTNYTNFQLANVVAEKLVNQILSRDIFMALNDKDSMVEKLYDIEGLTASIFGFDFANDSKGAATIYRRENRARFTKVYKPTKDLSEVDGSLVYDNCIYGQSVRLKRPNTVSAICGNLPLLSDTGEYFLIATLGSTTEVGLLDFGLVSCQCCPEALASSPSDHWCANSTLKVAESDSDSEHFYVDDDETMAVLGITFDSHTKKLTYIYIYGSSSYEDLYDVFSYGPTFTVIVIEDTVDVTTNAKYRALVLGFPGDLFPF